MRRKHGNGDACIVWADMCLAGETARAAAERYARDQCNGRTVEPHMSGRGHFRLVDGRKVYRVEHSPKAMNGLDAWTVYETHLTEVPK